MKIVLIVLTFLFVLFICCFASIYLLVIRPEQERQDDLRDCIFRAQISDLGYIEEDRRIDQCHDKYGY